MEKEARGTPIFIQATDIFLLRAFHLYAYLHTLGVLLQVGGAMIYVDELAVELKRIRDKARRENTQCNTGDAVYAIGVALITDGNIWRVFSDKHDIPEPKGEQIVATSHIFCQDDDAEMYVVARELLGKVGEKNA
jgi:hypothetical protein